MMKNKFFGYWAALGCFLIMFVHLGAIGLTGIMYVPISQSTGIEIDRLMVMITFTTIAAVIGSLTAAPIIEKITPKYSLLFSTVLLAVAMLGNSFANSLPVFCAMSILVGLLLAFGTNACIGAIVGSWFIKKRAKILGIVFAASALGSSFFQSLGGYLTDNYSFRVTYRVVALIILVIGIVSNLLFIRTPNQLGQKPLGFEMLGKDKKQDSGGAVIGITAKEALKTASFWLMFFGILLGAICVNTLVNYVARYLIEYGFSISQASNIAASRALFSTVIVIIVGFIAEKFGSRVYAAILYAGFIICALILVEVPVLTFGMAIFAMIFGAFAQPVITAMIPTITSGSFGNADYSKIVMYLTVATYIGAAILPFAVKAIQGDDGSLGRVFEVFSVLALIGGILLIIGICISPVIKRQKGTED